MVLHSLLVSERCETRFFPGRVLRRRFGLARKLNVLPFVDADEGVVEV